MTMTGCLLYYVYKIQIHFRLDTARSDIKTKKHQTNYHLSMQPKKLHLLFIYHTIIHNLSFNSMTCTSNLIRNMFDGKN